MFNSNIKDKTVSFGSLTRVFDNNIRFDWSIRNGFPRLMAYEASDEVSIHPDKLFIAPFDIVTFEMFLSSFMELLEVKKPTVEVIDCINAEYVDHRKTGRNTIQIRLMYGLNENLEAFISLRRIHPDNGELLDTREAIINNNGFHKSYVSENTLTEQLITVLKTSKKTIDRFDVNGVKFITSPLSSINYTKAYLKLVSKHLGSQLARLTRERETKKINT